MKLSFDLPHGKVTVGDAGDIEIHYCHNTPNVVGVCLDLAGELCRFLIAEQNRTSDELEDGLRGIQDYFVTGVDYERAALCRDARQTIAKLTAKNETLREELRRVTTPVSARVKPQPEIED